jgi:hypothetical protein
MSAETAIRYPVNYETEVILRDGARVYCVWESIPRRSAGRSSVTTG